MKLCMTYKAIGANVTAESPQKNKMARGLAGKSILQSLRQSYEQFRQNDLLPASYEIIYGHAWKAESENTNTMMGWQHQVKFER
jgi:malonyl-CoA O-methyltransferase